MTSKYLQPLPPPEISIAAHTERTWGQILSSWKKGWAAETTLADLEHYLEVQRKRVFEDNDLPPDYNWQLDWFRAKATHDTNVDYVRHRRAHIDDVKRMWVNFCSETDKNLAALGLEALRSMVLLNGAAILAALAVLSGQITTPTHAATIAAKCTIIFCTLSLIMLATGHSLIFLRAVEVVGTVRVALLGNIKHSKLYAVGRYLRRHYNRIIDIANALIFGSIAVFALGSFLAAIVLIVA